MSKEEVKGLDISVGLDLDWKLSEVIGKEDHLLAITTPDGISCEIADVEILEREEKPATIHIELHSSHGIGKISLIMAEKSFSSLSAAVRRSLLKLQEQDANV